MAVAGWLSCQIPLPFPLPFPPLHATMNRYYAVEYGVSRVELHTTREALPTSGMKYVPSAQRPAPSTYDFMLSCTISIPLYQIPSFGHRHHHKPTMRVCQTVHRSRDTCSPETKGRLPIGFPYVPYCHAAMLPLCLCASVCSSTAIWSALGSCIFRRVKVSCTFDSLSLSYESLRGPGHLRSLFGSVLRKTVSTSK